MSEPVSGPRGCRILLVEDERCLRDELSQFLQASGMRVEAAANIAAARELMTQHSFDLILMDLWLKQDNSFDFLRDIRLRHDIPCLVMTAQDNVASKTVGVTTGADDYILKPLNPRELLARLSSLRRGIAHDALKTPVCGRNFLSDGSGAISIIGALSIAMLVALAAVVIDAGSLYYARRNLQATSDAAALAAVQNPSNASAIAASVFSSNGYANPSLVVTTGVYTANESSSAQSRFSASASGVNAVRVRATLQQPTYFSTYFGLGREAMTLVAQATAARLPTASFGAGTALATPRQRRRVEQRPRPIRGVPVFRCR